VESRGIIIVLAVLSVLFPDYGIYFVAVAMLFVVARAAVASRKKSEWDKKSVELLFRLGSLTDLNEGRIADEMKNFECFRIFSEKFRKTSKLEFPKFGWRSSVVGTALKSALETGNVKILSKALEQISIQEQAISEASSALSSQKYTLLASIAISSGILGLISSVSGTSYLYYVLAQSLISAFWINSFENSIYESILFSLPLSLSGYFLALRFV
jgi:hypothetical protein